MSNVKDSLTQLFRYVSDVVDEKTWKGDPIITDSSNDVSITIPHPSTASKDGVTKSDPFSSICLYLSKPYVPQISLNFSYDNKKAALRFNDMLQEWNKNIYNEFFTLVNKLEGFSFKLQVKTTFKKTSSGIKREDIFAAPAGSVNYNDVIENFKKVTDLCNSSELMEDDKPVKSRVPAILICKEFSTDDLALDNSPFDNEIKIIHKIMLLEPKILSEKEVKKTGKSKKVVGEKDKFYTILANRADEQFYCRLTYAEFQRQPEHFGVQVWNKETLEMKKYIRAALKLVEEL